MDTINVVQSLISAVFRAFRGKTYCLLLSYIGFERNTVSTEPEALFIWFNCCGKNILDYK